MQDSSDTNSVITSSTRHEADDSELKLRSYFLIDPRSDLRASIDLVTLIAGVFNIFVMIYMFAFGWTSIPMLCLVGSGLSDCVLIIDIGSRFLTGTFF